MTSFEVVIAASALVVLVLGILSGYVRNRMWLSEPVLALAAGVGLGFVEFEIAGVAPGSETFLHAFQEAARLTLAISVVGAALRLPQRYFRDHWRALVVILGVGLPLMALTTTALAWAILSLPLLMALLIGAILAPTDPVLADSIVAGKIAERHLPRWLSSALSVESGANDGLALLLVMIPVLLLTRAPGEAAAHWLSVVLLWEVVGGVAIGVALGWLAGRALVWAHRKPYSERVSGLTVSVALALGTVASVHLLGSSGILAAFVAGVFFRRHLFAIEDPQHEHVQEAIGRFFDLPVFILFGFALPYGDWAALDWPLPAFAAAVLLARRIPVWLLLKATTRTFPNYRAALFCGWFGPIGIAALYYAAEASFRTGDHRIWAVGSFVVFASIVMHGISATPLVRRYGSSAGDGNSDLR